MIPSRMNVAPNRCAIGKFIEKTSRDDTPSTVCSDHDDEFLTGTLDAHVTETSPEYFIPAKRAPQVAIPPGTSRYRSDTFTKGPFRFPEVSNEAQSCRPVCMVCQKELIVGQPCRELRTCGHCFHSDCLEEYLGSRSRCPVCQVRCKPTRSRKKEGNRGRPYWSPDFDTQLLSCSDKLDRERRLKLYLLKGTRDNAPRSQVFLKSALPTLLEESPESLATDDGTMISLCRWIARERQIQKLRDMDYWSKDMKRLAITFVFSVLRVYIEQAMFVDLFHKKLRVFSSKKTELVRVRETP